MDLKRILANAIARRIAYVIVAAILAALGFSGKAHAIEHADEGQAKAACEVEAAAIFPFDAGSNIDRIRCIDDGNQCVVVSTRTYFQRWQNKNRTSGAVGQCSLATAKVGQNVHTWATGQTCAARSSQVTTRLPLGGSLQCINGCMYRYMLNGDDETSTRSTTGATCNNTKDNCPAGTVMNVLMQVCQPVEPTCPAGQHVAGSMCVPDTGCPDGMVQVQPSTPGGIASGELYCKPSVNECPPGNIKSPAGTCLPGEGQCAAGEAKKKDGTCGKDSDGDGEADDDDEDPENDTDKESFSGGDSCNAPPTCNGSPIMCGQARIQWRIECNTRKSRNVSGGSCGAVPICTGEKCDALEYSSLVMQWRTACALEKATPGGGTSGDNQDVIDHLSAQTLAERTAIRAEGTEDGLVGDEESKIWAEEGEGEVPSSGLLGGGGASCTFSITIRGKTIGMSPQAYQILAFIRWLFIAAAYVWVAVQLGK